MLPMPSGHPADRGPLGSSLSAQHAAGRSTHARAGATSLTPRSTGGSSHTAPRGRQRGSGANGWGGSAGAWRRPLAREKARGGLGTVPGRSPGRRWTCGSRSTASKRPRDGCGSRPSAATVSPRRARWTAVTPLQRPARAPTRCTARPAPSARSHPFAQFSEFVVGCSWHTCARVGRDKAPLFSRHHRRNREEILSFSASIHALQTAIN